MALRKRLSVGVNVDATAKELRPHEKSPGRNRSRSTSSDADVAHKLQRNNDIASMLERNEIVPAGATSSTDSTKCDLCDGLWTDESASALFEFRPSGIVCDQSCLAFAATFVAKNPSIQSRDDYLEYRRSMEPNQSGVFKIVAEKAVDLPSVRWVGRQDPYVRLALLPWNEPVQTKAAMSGGKNPIWLDAHANEMRLQHRCNSSNNPVPTLEVQVWNDNYMFTHDLLASSLVTTAPLLQHPGISVSRWFTLVSPSTSSSSLSQRARIYFTLQFEPQTRLRRLVSSDPADFLVRDHKFRVHTLKTVGVCIVSCGVCERVIMSTTKTQWGYRCEGCGIDVHKGCMMLANTNLPCPRRDDEASGSNDDESDQPVLKKDRYVVSPKDGSSGYLLVQPPTTSASFGKLYVNLQGVHMCSKQCRPADNVHASNVFEGDTYCRLSVDGLRHESKEVYKSADPVFDDKTCFEITHRDTAFVLEVVDLTTNLTVGSMSVLLFELLQMDADEILQSFATSRFVHRFQSSLPMMDGSALFNRAKTTFPLKVKSQVVGHARLSLHYAEEKQKLLLYVPKQRMVLQGREEKDFSVEALKTNIDRLARVLTLAPWLEQQYLAIITWRHPVQSGVILVWFSAACLFVNAEYLPASLFLLAIAYMLHTLWQRLTGPYLFKWVAFDEDAMEATRLFRPVASLFVAVIEASLAPKEAASTTHYVFVRAVYLPNDADHDDSGLVYSGGAEFLVGRTHAVRHTAHPTWRDGSNVVSHLTPPGLFRPNTPPKKEHIFRNAQVSWPTLPGASGTPVTDYHTLVYPLLQAAKHFDNGRELLVPWTAFPGLLRFDLVQVTDVSPGHAVAAETVLGSTAPLPLVRLIQSDEGDSTLTLPLLVADRLSATTDASNLTVRVKIQLPNAPSSTSTAPSAKAKVGPADKKWSTFVRDALAEKDTKTTLTTTLFGALWKAKDTTTMVQNAIGRLCATVACTQNLFNWTHPWKTALVFALCVGGAILFSFVPARYIILVGGLLEFVAGLREDRPPSNTARNILWNFISSLPTDTDLIQAYDEQRNAYVATRTSAELVDAVACRRLKLQALWLGTVQVKMENDRTWKPLCVAFRRSRFVFWKSTDDVDACLPPLGQLIIDGMDDIKTIPDLMARKPEDPPFIFYVLGNTGESYQEKRFFGFADAATRDDLLNVIKASFSLTF